MIQKYIEEKEEDAGKEFHGAGQHVRRHEFFAVFTLFVAENDKHGEQGYQEEEEHDEGQGGGGPLRAQPLEKQRQSGHDDGKHDNPEREFPNRDFFAHSFCFFVLLMRIL